MWPHPGNFAFRSDLGSLPMTLVVSNLTVMTLLFKRFVIHRLRCNSAWAEFASALCTKKDNDATAHGLLWRLVADWSDHTGLSRHSSCLIYPDTRLATLSHQPPTHFRKRLPASRVAFRITGIAFARPHWPWCLIEPFLDMVIGTLVNV